MKKFRKNVHVATVLFDLDGTLADTAPDLARALNEVRLELGYPPLPYELIRPVVSHGTNALVDLGFKNTPEEAAFEEIKRRLLDYYEANIATQTRLFPGMEALLQELESKGKKWGVVTNKPSWLTEPLMRELKLSERAACIVSGDSAEQPKPHPAPMMLACKLSDSRAENCIYVGDAQRDIEAGRNAGMTTLAALFGYIGETDQPRQWGADGLIEHPGEILEWID